MDNGIRSEMNAAARQFVCAQVGYSFSERERRVLRPFFSNSDEKVFFITGLPTAVSTALLAMYSRLKNPRGIRGHFVDNLVPLLMMARMSAKLPGEEAKPWKAIQAEFRNKGLNTLDKIIASDGHYEVLFDTFCSRAADPEYWQRVADSDRIQEFLSMWLDAYGHNSIARVGHLVFCVEDASILAVKSIEWTRPASGYIELSTRYVDISSKGQYPISAELGLINKRLGSEALSVQSLAMQTYEELMGANVDGLFPKFLQARWGSVVSGESLKAGVLGESCDVLGNLLPATTLTQVGVAVSAEAFPQVLKHLYLDDTPENVALADLIKEEAGRVGLGHFVRHEMPSEWELATWNYLQPTSQFFFRGDDDAAVTGRLAACGSHDVGKLAEITRGEYDKLPSDFELASFTMRAAMSYRGWRDVHRQGFCTHLRGRVTPLNGFYVYPKPAPMELHDAFSVTHRRNLSLYRQMMGAGVPDSIAEYPMSLGNIVQYLISSNLREWEFCNWQRTKWAVNDEVRGQFLVAEWELRRRFWWWSKLSRADMTRHYVFARGKHPVPWQMV